MEIFDSRYFKINKVLLKYAGLWFDQGRKKNLLLQTILVSFFVLNTIPQYYGVYKNLTVELHKTLAHLLSILYFNGVTLKYVSSISAQKKLTTVFQTIAENWVEIKDPKEQEILIKFSDTGRTLTIFYITYLISALTLFITGPLLPIVLDKTYPLENRSRPLLYVLYGEYGVDSVTNYTNIYVIESVACIVSLTVVCTIDCMYAACIEHCLALFSIVNFTKQLELSYSMSFLFLIGANGACNTVLCLLIITSENFMEKGRFVSVLIGTTIHLFYLSWPGQKMINYSTDLFKDAYFNQWYKCSIRTQNLLRFMALRCVVPCYLTAGGIYIMNFENFALIVKTSVSYITVFSSMT